MNLTGQLLRGNTSQKTVNQLTMIKNRERDPGVCGGELEHVRTLPARESESGSTVRGRERTRSLRPGTSRLMRA